MVYSLSLVVEMGISVCCYLKTMFYSITYVSTVACRPQNICFNMAKRTLEFNSILQCVQKLLSNFVTIILDKKVLCYMLPIT